MHETTTPARPIPTPERERNPRLDMLRGFALFGILLVNMEDFSAPHVPGLATEWTGTPDKIVSWLLRFAAEGKFRAVFAFLFGLGFALQLQRSQTQEAGFTARTIRRLTVLLLIGLAHYTLLWEADILMNYALVGFLILPFARRPARSSLRAAALFAAIAVLLLSMIALLARPRPGGSAPVRPEKAAMVAVYSHGSYREVVVYRTQQIGTQIGRILSAAPLILMLFLLGLAAGKAGIAQEPARHRTLLRRVFGWGLLFGIAANALVTVYASHLMALPKVARLPIVASYVLGGPMLSLAYLAGLTLLLLNPVWQARLHFLTAPGRLALTNYLMQSVVCTTLFYGYGLGWYNHVSPVAGVGLCLLLFLVQTALSFWWLRRFPYGPAEWVWRALTYGTRALEHRRVRLKIPQE